MFLDFPREVAFPNRRLVKDQKEFYKCINIYNGKRNLHCTVYSFQEINGKSPVYESANVNYIFFDFDGEESYKPVKKFVRFLRQEEIKFAVNLSGGGFHVYIAVKQRIVPDIKASIRKFQEDILNSYSILQYADPHIFGNVAQLTRITNTWNLRRNRFCIALKPEEMELPLEQLYKLAKKQRSFNWFWSPGKTLEIPEVVSEKVNTYKEINNIKIYAIEPCLDLILKKRNPTHDERFFLCLYLSDEFRKGINIKEVNKEELIKKIVEYMEKLNWLDFCDNPNKNKSTPYQVRNIINKNLNRVPNCEWRRVRNMCPGKCMMTLL